MHTRLYNYFAKTIYFITSSLFFVFFFRKKILFYRLIEFVNNITEAMSKKYLTLGVFIDLSKAFNTVDHGIRLKKLENYKITRTEHSSFSDLC